MALITCPECQKSVSDQAFACPGCGFPIHKAAAKPIPTKENASASKPLPAASAAAAAQPAPVPAPAQMDAAPKIKPCVSCGAADLRSLEMVWTQGKSSSFSLASLGFSISQNALSKLATPPSERELSRLRAMPRVIKIETGFMVIVFGIFGLLFIIISFSFLFYAPRNTSEDVLTEGFVFAVVAAVFLAGAFLYARWSSWRLKRISQQLAEEEVRYSVARNRWASSWMCMRCGNIQS